MLLSKFRLITFLQQLGLPSDNILVPVFERINVFSNLQNVLIRLSTEDRERSMYLSKFVSAVSSGLFDAALNYLWDETIHELRRRVVQYDLTYFYDNAVGGEKRNKLKTEEDLVKLDDSELIHGSKEIGLISDMGFKHLDYIRYMRNWASAAHPNQNQITGFQLLSWLETCIKEVISLPISNVAIEIKRLLRNIKEDAITSHDAKQIASFFLHLTSEQSNNLAQGFFGIYTRQDTTSKTRENIHLLLPFLWGSVDEDVKKGFGIRYGRFVANNEQTEKQLARQFLEVVQAESYIPDDLRATEIDTALQNLRYAHRSWNNYYNEPPFARELEKLVGSHGRLPNQIEKEYVTTLVEVFITNGNGKCWDAEPIYTRLIDQFDSNQALLAILSFSNSTISSRLQFSLCESQYKLLLEMMKTKVSAHAVKELIDQIEKYNGPLHRMKDDSNFKKRIEPLQKIIG
ncbi:hypothetical protein [Paenibacillus sp. 3LSP]|uniref:hypothetical protein n=1 Tax=Paenibacillus sp. 3LSP TaxID=2800795 RepID=UPI002905F75A|nr:hypothetical protein [Paenibacillus sp. 3LSP]